MKLDCFMTKQVILFIHRFTIFIHASWIMSFIWWGTPVSGLSRCKIPEFNLYVQCFFLKCKGVKMQFSTPNNKGLLAAPDDWTKIVQSRSKDAYKMIAALQYKLCSLIRYYLTVPKCTNKNGKFEFYQHLPISPVHQRKDSRWNTTSLIETTTVLYSSLCLNRWFQSNNGLKSLMSYA